MPSAQPSTPVGQSNPTNARTTNRNAPAYSETTAEGQNTMSSSTRRDEMRADWTDFTGAREGEFEFTLGGGGVSSRKLDSSNGGVTASLGYYINDTLEVVGRQTINYFNPSGGDSGWGGSTRVALDKHLFEPGRFRPFVGVNFGAVYGDGTNDSLVAGLETGVKYYVQPRTFIFALVDYAWTFKDSDDATDNFSDGGFQWTLGVGFNF